MVGDAAKMSRSEPKEFRKMVRQQLRCAIEKGRASVAEHMRCAVSARRGHS